MASARAPQNSGANRKVAQQQFDQWKKDLNNWGLASDHPQYVSPSEVVGAVHDFALVSLGIYLIDNWDLEALSEAAAARKRWEFLLTAAPPPKGGTGSPMNPIATLTARVSRHHPLRD